MVDNERAVRAWLLAPEFLCALLRKHFETTAGVQVVESGVADVVVLMGRNWRRRFLAWRERNSEIPVVLVTTADDPGLRAAVALGIDAIVSTEEAVEEVEAAILAVAGGRGYESPGMHPALRLAYKRMAGPSAGDWSNLTPTEQVIALDAGRGLSGKQLAHLHGISEATVKTHLSRIYTKISVSSKTALACYITEHGLNKES